MTWKAFLFAVGALLAISFVAGGILLLQRWSEHQRATGTTPRPIRWNWVEPESMTAPERFAATQAEPQPPIEPIDDDFASEHRQATFAYDYLGGPEGMPEAESPHGLAGMDNPRTPANWLRRREMHRIHRWSTTG